jgi:hypothetical protein
MLPRSLGAKIREAVLQQESLLAFPDPHAHLSFGFGIIIISSRMFNRSGPRMPTETALTGIWRIFRTIDSISKVAVAARAYETFSSIDFCRLDFGAQWLPVDPLRTDLIYQVTAE